jgi:predicted permease
MRTFLQDLRFAARSLSRSRTFTIAVVLTLALTIGATTAVFSVVNAVLLRPLPFADPERLVWITSVASPGRRDAPFSLPEFLDYREQTRTLESLHAYASWSAILTGAGGPAERLQGMRLSAAAFDALGIAPAAGRLLIAADDDVEAARVAVLGYGLWERRFGGDPSAIGRVIRLNGQPHEIVGVLPQHFPLPLRQVEVVVPLAPRRDPWHTVRTSVNFLRFFGRVRADVTTAQAEAELNGVCRLLKERFPTEYATKLGVAVAPLHAQLVVSYHRSLWLLLSAVVLVLGVACANLVNLLLARALVREREVAIRVALGAGGWAVARQLLAEPLLLSAAGGSAGLLLAAWGRSALVSFGPPDLPRLQETSIDWQVILFTGALVAIVSAIFAVVPFWQVRTRSAGPSKSRGDLGGIRAARTRQGIVISEVALAVLLVVCSTLLVRSLVRLQRADPGFDPSGAVIARISLPRDGYTTREAMLQFAQRFGDGLRALPGVRVVGGANIAPLSGVFASVEFLVSGRPPLAPGDIPEAHFRVVTDGYFAAMGIPLLQGRGFSTSDTAATVPVAVVNRHLAAHFFPDGNAVGSHLLIDDNNAGRRPVEIVGIAGDVRQMTLDGDPTFDIHISLAQVQQDTLVWLANNQFWAVRSDGDPQAIGNGIRRALDAADATVGLASIRTGTEYVDAATAGRRFTAWLLTGFALSALLLALIGLYAVMAYTVAQRTRELGVRIAMGASGLEIGGLVLRQAVATLSIGALAGVGLALPATRAMAGLLYQTTPHDPMLFATVGAALVAIGALTAAGPAHRASRVDPLVALRAE